MTEQRHEMASAAGSGSCAVIWQGYHHAWEYNHRLNRIGSYVRYQDGAEGALQAMVGHTAASGTGGDVAHVAEFVTHVSAQGVGFQPGHGETLVECTRAETTTFRIKVDDLDLAPELAGKESYAVVLNGFDLYAQDHSDKLVCFDLEVTDPTVYARGTKIRFNLLGTLCFDCRTAECHLWPVRMEAEDAGSGGRSAAQAAPEDGGSTRPRKRGIPRHPAIVRAARWLRRQIVRFTDLEDIRRSIIAGEGDTLRRRLFRLFGRQYYLRLLKWRINTPYVLRVHYMIVGGDASALRVTETPFLENAYTWDTEHEILSEQRGVQSIRVQGDDSRRYAASTLAFKRFALRTKLDERHGIANPVQWGKGMHMLEWNVALRDVRPAGAGVAARLDLFYKCWSEAMNEVITLTTWGAIRSAGSAWLGARLVLLQFENGTLQQDVLPGEIDWPGGGREAGQDPRACLERPATWTEDSRNS